MRSQYRYPPPLPDIADKNGRPVITVKISILLTLLQVRFHQIFLPGQIPFVCKYRLPAAFITPPFLYASTISPAPVSISHHCTLPQFFAAVRVICDHCIGTRRTDEPHIFFLIYSPYMDFLFLPPALFHKSFILNVVKCRVQCIRSHHIRSITDRIDDSIAV